MFGFGRKLLSEYVAKAAIDQMHHELDAKHPLDRAQRLIAIAQRVERAMHLDGRKMKGRHRKRIDELTR